MKLDDALSARFSVSVKPARLILCKVLICSLVVYTDIAMLLIQNVN